MAKEMRLKYAKPLVSIACKAKEEWRLRDSTCFDLQPSNSETDTSHDPADLNVIEGTYNVKAPNRPHLVPGKDTFICGNEGVGYIEQVGSGVSQFKPGQQGESFHLWDLVCFTTQLQCTAPQQSLAMSTRQMGTWQTRQVLDQTDIAPSPEGLSAAEACTLTSNPTSALLMLRNYVALDKGEYVIQNASNSAVGQAIIQLAKASGLKTINLFRERPKEEDTETLRNQLYAIGADHAVTHAEAKQPEFKKWVMKELTGGKGVRLGLNCVSGPDTIPLLGVLADSGHVVTYGALSKKPLSFQNGWFIFRDGHARGFNLTRWFNTHSQDDKRALFEELGQFIRSKQLSAPQHRVVDLTGLEEQALLNRVQEAIAQQYAGFSNTKTLFKWT